MHDKLIVPLDPREDREFTTYHIGRKKFPGVVDASEGVAVLIWVGESGEEELQIASLDNEDTTFSQFTRRPDRLKIALESRVDSYDKKFYICKFQVPGLIDFRGGATFMVFTSKPGQEELQIVAPILRGQLDAPSAQSSPSHMRFRAVR